MRSGTVLSTAAFVAVLARLSNGRERREPLYAMDVPSGVTVSVVVPARDEEHRIEPCLRAIRGEAWEVVVVDDRSTDRTAEVAAAHGARVVPGAEPPEGWIGKPWALQQGLEAARGDVVVCLDADTRPRRGLLGALVQELERFDWVTVGPRFECRSGPERWLHASLLATLVYRFGAADSDAATRILANGQCTAARRQELLEAGGYTHAPNHMTDDVAQARALAQRGWKVAFRDGADLLEVRMHESLAEVWREWGRSIAMADVLSARELAADLALIWLAFVPKRRLPLLALRLAVLGATSRSYTQRGLPYWLSPLADPVAAARLTLSTVRPPRTWKGRAYPGTGRRRGT